MHVITRGVLLSRSVRLQVSRMRWYKTVDWSSTKPSVHLVTLGSCPRKSMADFEWLCPALPKLNDKKDTPSNAPVHMESNTTVTIVLIIVPFLLLISGIIVAIYLRRRSKPIRKNVEGGLYSKHQEFVNYATGLAWSHYTGYLSKILPEFERVMVESVTYKAYPDRIITEWILLCPKSGKSSRITDDPRITLEESLTIPGSKPTIDVYRITEDKESKPWYCCIEFPSSLMSLGKEAGVISEDTIALEVKRFSFYIMNILNHEKNSGCRGKAVALYYDDKNSESTHCVSQVLLDHIERVQHRRENKDDRVLPQVCLLHTGLQHRKTTEKFLDFEKTVSTKCQPSILDLKADDQRIVLKIINQSRWIVLYDIQGDIHSDYEWVIKSIEKRIKDGTCDLIAVFSGPDQENTTRFIPWTIAIDIDQEKHASDKVKRIICGETVQLSSDIVLGDLSFGLTWAFYINYLKYVLPDLFHRMKETILHESQNASLDQRRHKQVISKCLWQIIPTTCKFTTLNEFDEDLSTPIPVKPLKTQLFGTKRVFTCSLYHFKRSSFDYYFLGDVFTPCKVLWAMKESDIVRLSDRNMEKQRNRLKSQMNSLLKTVQKIDSPDLNIKVISFNDRGKKKLSEIMCEQIDSDVKMIEGNEGVPTPAEHMPLLERS
ncbi:hypothetical protein FSP39_019709 [Pinctada imbricata]|uniref:STING ligand-binding domain-containing protein n=1 Tax=Pinctada imbricata TaxID=66713 RepID=A0AA88YWF4_PINIB|nr:hypothetical protein FSP39_019709 [Pinctada imbricata]